MTDSSNICVHLRERRAMRALGWMIQGDVDDTISTEDVTGVATAP